MLFTEPSFLFYFLPLVLALHLLAGRRARNALLLVASLFFYAWGEPLFVLGLLLSIAFNYACGLRIDATRAQGAATWTAIGVAGNLLLLASFKYGGFTLENANALRAALGMPALVLEAPALPIGISFFTFQALSYLIDLRRGHAEVQRRPLDLALYIAMFPQLIAGPIVRYADVARQLRERVVTLSRFASGVRRFALGLGKKLIVANTLAWPADRIFAAADATGAALGPDDLSFAVAWLGVACYTLQIYFDFSGYSDMAIGLARMFGFEYRENFDYPYTARSVTEFWRRWHISLSSWFRDYLYKPLGGSRRGELRTQLNLWSVFLLCGLWHGAAWSFVLWGAYHGAALVAERALPIERLPRGAAPLRRMLALGIVAIGWVFFRAETPGGAGAMLAAMAGLGAGDGVALGLDELLDARSAAVLAAAAIGSTALPARLGRRLLAASGGSGWQAAASGALQLAAFAALLLACAALVAAGTYNPFLYFRF